MKLMRINKIAVFIVILALVGVARYLQTAQAPADTRYMNPALPTEERIEILLSQMTLDEKIGQMALVEKNSIRAIGDISRYGLGGILSGGSAKPKDNTPEGWLEMIAEHDDASRKSRLGIPILYGIDAIHGHGGIPGATIFPHAIGLGMTKDEQLVEKIAAATAEEVRATGGSWVFSPNLDAPEDIRWGRTYEGFSDDPKLNAKMGRAVVKGLQGMGTAKTGIVATAKHYIGAGGMKWGSSSNKNFKIDQGRTPDNYKMLRESYLPPFKEAVDAGVLSIMAGLNSYGDQKISANKYLLTDVLKEELGFEGFVVSDWYAVYEIPGGDYVAAVTAINAGIDMVMLPYDYDAFGKNISTAVRKGDIKVERIDDAVRRILRAKFSAGLFEKDFHDREERKDALKAVGSSEHRALAREAVAKSISIMRNRSNALPIDPSARRILIAGSAADNTGMQSGGWTLEWQGVTGNVIPGATSILQGIREVAGPNASVSYDTAANFEHQELLADIGIAVVGEKPYAEGWGDAEKPALSQEDIEAISRLRKASKKLIVVIVSGRPLSLPDESEGWDAIVAAWLPGSEGGGVADRLFGK